MLLEWSCSIGSNIHIFFLFICPAVAIMPSNNGSTVALSSIGSNGHSFADCGVENNMAGATKAINKGCWTIGLVNSKFKYLRWFWFCKILWAIQVGKIEIIKYYVSGYQLFYFIYVMTFISAETYGYRTNANGKSLKNKQYWTLSPSGDGESVILKSHLGRYIAVDQFGNVTCDQVEYH